MRHRYLDAVKALAIFLVVGVHVGDGAAGRVLAMSAAGGGGPAAVAFGFRIAVGLAAVNLFFMASGALLLRPKGGLPPPLREWPAWYARRFGKLLPPFLIWSVFYLVFRKLEGWGWPPSMRERLLLPPGTFYHLWFMYVLFGLYLLTPALLALRARLSWRGKALAAAALLALGGLEPVFDSWIRPDNGMPLFGIWLSPGKLNALQYIWRFVGHLGIFWTAALLHERPAPGKIGRWGWLLTSLAIPVPCLLGTLLWYAGVLSGRFPPDPTQLPMAFTSPVSLAGVVMALGLFEALRGFHASVPAPAPIAIDGVAAGAQVPARRAAWREWTERAVARLGRDSFGIYLVHPLAVWLWNDRLGARWLSTATGAFLLAGLTAATAGCMLAGWAATSLLRRAQERRWFLPD